MIVEPLTLTDYAKLRGCSVMSVSKAVSKHRLQASVGRDERGRPTIIDPALADREWEANTRHRVDRPPQEPRIRQGTPSPRQSGSSKLTVDAGSSPAPGTIPDYNTSRAIKEAAAARREAAQADMAELQRDQLRGKLGDVAELTNEFNSHIADAKARLLALPAQVGQECPDLVERVVPVVDRLIRMALEKLAADGIRS